MMKGMRYLVTRVLSSLSRAMGRQEKEYISRDELYESIGLQRTKNIPKNDLKSEFSNLNRPLPQIPRRLGQSDRVSRSSEELIYRANPSLATAVSEKPRLPPRQSGRVRNSDLDLQLETLPQVNHSPPKIPKPNNNGLRQRRYRPKPNNNGLRQRRYREKYMRQLESDRLSRSSDEMYHTPRVSRSSEDSIYSEVYDTPQNPYLAPLKLSPQSDRVSRSSEDYHVYDTPKHLFPSPVNSSPTQIPKPNNNDLLQRRYREKHMRHLESRETGSSFHIPSR